MQEVNYFEERELKLSQLRLIVIVVLVISVAMIAYTISWFVGYENKYGFFHEITATVIEHKQLDGDKHDILSFKIDGNEYRVTSTYISDNEIGDEVTVYYDENNPLGVIYSKDTKLYSLPIISGIFLLCSIGLMIVYILFDRGIRKDKQLLDLEMAKEMKSHKEHKVNKGVGQKKKTTSSKTSKNSGRKQ